MAKMTKDEVVSLLTKELEDSVSYYGSELTADRAKALDYYYGRKKGVLSGEIGRSSVVSRDVLETVEWATAQLMQMFEGEDIVQFDPVGPEDIENAKQETDYVSFILSKDNDGFQFIHDWVKDGLLSRVGIVHVGWDDEPSSAIETYTGLVPAQLELLLSDDGTELVEKTERTVKATGPDGQVVEQPVCDVRVRVESKEGRIRVCGIPPEEFRISRGVRSIDEVLKKTGTLVAHVFSADNDKLSELGFSASQIESIRSADDDKQNNSESLARDNPVSTGDDNRADKEQEITWVSRIFCKIDYDGDGKAELREIVMAGKEIASNEPCEEVPYSDWCPVPMPHRWSGQSYADLVMDLMEVRTTLKRGMLDQLYLSANPMKEVVESQLAAGGMQDLLTARIGGVVRVKVAGTVREMQMQPNIGPAMQMTEYTDTERENRTGLTRYNQGLDAESLNKTAAGMAQILSQSQIRLKLVARLFAERGMKRLVRLVHSMTRRHQDFPRLIKLRNEFVTVDPREWRDRQNLTASVGLGAGNKGEQMQGITQLLQIQMPMLAQGLPFVNPQNVFSSLSKLTELLGYKDVQNYFTDPSKMPQKSPEQIQQEKTQAMQQQAQMEAYIEGEKEKAKAAGRAEGERMKIEADMQKQMAEIAARERMEGRKLDQERMQAQADYQLALRKMEQDAAQFTQKQSQDAYFKEQQLRVDVIGKTYDAQIEQTAVKSLGG